MNIWVANMDGKAGQLTHCSIAECDFILTEQMFQSLFEMIVSNRNKKIAPDLLGRSLLGIVVLVAVTIFLRVERFPFDSIWYVHLVIGLGFIIYAWGVVTSIRFYKGKQQPNWNSDRWEFRKRLCLEAISHKGLSEMIYGAYSSEHNRYFNVTTQIYSLFYIFFPALYWSEGWPPIFFDLFPGVIPHYPGSSTLCKNLPLCKTLIYDETIKQSIGEWHNEVLLKDIQEVLIDSSTSTVILLHRMTCEKDIVLNLKYLDGISWNELEARIPQ